MLEILSYEVYGMERAMIASGLPMAVDSSTIVASEKRANILGSAKIGSGHDSFLKSVVVVARVKYPLYWSKQFQRYHFADITSSQSTMHRVTKFNLSEQCNQWVDKEIVGIIQKKIDAYNEMEKLKLNEVHYISGCEYSYYEFNNEEVAYCMKNKFSYSVEVVSKKDLFMQIISCLPSGFEMEMEIVTNYLQLKTMLEQRQHHKLPDWKVFCDWIKTLPNFTKFTTKEAK